MNKIEECAKYIILYVDQLCWRYKISGNVPNKRLEESWPVVSFILKNTIRDSSFINIDYYNRKISLNEYAIRKIKDGIRRHPTTPLTIPIVIESALPTHEHTSLEYFYVYNKVKSIFNKDPVLGRDGNWVHFLKHNQKLFHHLPGRYSMVKAYSSNNCEAMTAKEEQAVAILFEPDLIQYLQIVTSIRLLEKINNGYLTFTPDDLLKANKYKLDKALEFTHYLQDKQRSMDTSSDHAFNVLGVFKTTNQTVTHAPDPPGWFDDSYDTSVGYAEDKPMVDPVVIDTIKKSEESAQDLPDLKSLGKVKRVIIEYE